jgi:hypothetical protein
MSEHNDDKAFDQYRLLILNWFKRIDTRLEHIEAEISIMKVDLVATRIKAGLWGALAGALPTAVAAILIYLKNA